MSKQQLYYCGANTRILLRQYFNRGINKKYVAQPDLTYSDVLVEEAVAIQLIVEQASEPLYSYADTEYSAVADGKILVLGKLVTNVSSNIGTSYLAGLIASLNPNKNISAAAAPDDQQMNDIFSKIESSVPLSSQEVNAYANYITNAGNVRGYQVKLNQDRYNGNLLFTNGRIDQHNMGFDLIIEIGDHLELEATREVTNTSPQQPLSIKRLQPVRVITLKDVKIKSTQYQIAATSEPIAEVYEFFARTVIYSNR
jgi:hypothetical protein